MEGEGKNDLTHPLSQIPGKFIEEIVLAVRLSNGV